MSDERFILPCPFCGSSDIEEDWGCLMESHPEYQYGDITCKNCQGSMSIELEGREIYGGASNKLISKWNTRVCDISSLNDGWISVEDRLPQKNVEVLVLSKLGVDIDKWGSLSSRYAGTPLAAHAENCEGFTNYGFGEITHWRPLPEPPEA